MKILLASAEVTPFAKTGGLADVCGALPLALSELEHEVAVIMPAYQQVHQSGQQIESTGISLDIPIGNHYVSGELLRSTLPNSNVMVYLVRQDNYFDRKELYRAAGEDYRDNCERFVFFSRAVMEAIHLLDLAPDVLHVNDWQTGLIPAYLKIEYASARGFENIATVMTIHNLAYQGQFWHWDMLMTGLDWKYFNWREMEFFGRLNLLKTGIVFADAITTVSPRYAQEIQTAEDGAGLHGVIAHRSDVLSGILNGVDDRVWNPSCDPHLISNYDVSNWQEGKAKCKCALQSEMGLPTRPEVPLIGLVGRLACQKGFDLIGEVLPKWAESEDVQWVFLGTGEPEYHQLLEIIGEKYSDRVGVQLGFSDALAHRIEAGADMFLMPSQYEPCGLNQMYSLKYGTVPIVRATGGLADTVIDANEQNLIAQTANGFSFEHYSPLALDETLRRACKMFGDVASWQQLVERGMRQDWSWNRSAQNYVDFYQQTISRVQDGVLS